MVRHRFVQVVAQIPAMRQIDLHVLHELPLRTDPLEKHNALKLEEDNRVDGRTSHP